MKQRQHRPTSSAGEIHIKPHKESHKERIISGLIKLRIGGNHEQIADASGLRPDQAWKRLNELCKEMKIYDTGRTRPLKSGVPGIIWQLIDLSQIPERKPSEISFTPTVNIQQTLFQ